MSEVDIRLSDGDLQVLREISTHGMGIYAPDVAEAIHGQYDGRLVSSAIAHLHTHGFIYQGRDEGGIFWKVSDRGADLLRRLG